MRRREFLLAAAAVPDMTIVQFEETLSAMRKVHYGRRTVDILNTGFRPVGGSVADFAAVGHQGRLHFFYIERRLAEGTPFYPGHEIYFGHASTANFFDWEVHDPVLLIRPGTWEGGHMWAPSILPHQGEFVMAYTGVNANISQDLGIASSRDLFEWRRWDTNPISLWKKARWMHWRPDAISSCRDPYLFRHDGRIWMTYTANTRDPAPCVALASTTDLREWEDHGPILKGPVGGYEPRLQGGHPQGSLESSSLVHRNGRWLLLVHAARRGATVRNWVFESADMLRFDLDSGREFWPGAYTTEIVKEKDGRALLACAGQIRFGEVNWMDPRPTARFLRTREQIEAWL
ncbi:MAG: hypothetical protein ACE15B_23070 [Bryobacteraceae bacterium]